MSLQLAGLWTNLQCATQFTFFPVQLFWGFCHLDSMVLSVYPSSIPTIEVSLTVQVEPIRNFFAALFLASIGMLIHVHSLWNHVDILLASVILVITIKTIIIALVVKGFGYNNKTSLLVRFYLIYTIIYSI